MIRYSCHSENFGVFSPEDTFTLVAALGFDCIDVAARSLVPQEKISERPLYWGEYFKNLSARTGLPLSELFLSDIRVGGRPVSPVFAADCARDYWRAFRDVCEFARAAGFLSVMGGAGTAEPSLGFDGSFAAAAGTLKEEVRVAREYGLAFHVEPSRLSLLNTVDAALAMVRAAPGLRYSLDFLHYQIHGVPESESMKLLPCAGHLHARQAKTGVGKCDFAEGEIDYPVIVKEMKRLNWSGDIAMEFWCSDQLREQGVQAVEQNVVMRYTLKTLFRRP